MALEEKYKVLLDTARSSGINDLNYAEQDGVLQIRGTAPSADVKNKLWEIYGNIDPNFATGDVVMDVEVATEVPGSEVRVITDSSNLNIRKGPGTDQPIVGKAAKDEIITLISKANDQWWLVRTKDNEEEYCFAQYLQTV